MYHGTSIGNLRSILKQGIVPNPADKVWADDPDVGKSSLSRESLPGSYWTSNLGTATSSSTTARKEFGDDQLIIIALIAEGSASADEDSINAALLRGFGAMYEELFQGGIVMDEIPKISSLAYWGKGYGREHKNYAPEMLQSYAKYVHNELSANPDKQPVPAELMKELMETMMLRALAYSDEKEGGQWSRDQYVKEMERLADEGQAPRWQPLAQMEQVLLRIRETLTKYYTKTAFHSEDMFSHTLRTEEPVTYRGANRIIGVIVHPHEYKNPRTLYYGTLPDDYREQYRQRVGPNRGIVGPQGNVLEPSEVQDEPEQVAASVGMTEARAGRRYYLNGPNGEHFMYPSNKAGFPSTVLVPIDTQDLKTATNVIVVRFNPRNMKKLMNELARPSLVRTEEQERIFRIYQEAIDDRNMRPYLKMMYEMPYTRLIELNGRDRIYKYVITDLKQQVATFQSIFGEVPELGESHFTPFHNAQLFIPDNMRPASKKIALTVLEEVYDRLQGIDTGAVFGGHIIIMPLTADGEYVAKTGEIRMNANTRNPTRAVITLLHEYGHKLQYEHMTPEQIKMLRTKYVELLREGESHMGNIDVGSEVEHLASQIKVGMPVKFVGRGKKGWGSNPNYIVVAFGKTAKGIPGVTIADDDPGRFVRGTIPFPNILNPKRWKLPFEGITTAKQLAHTKPSDEWFPTKYSMTDEEEWWAELFAFYAMGNLKGEPGAWVNKFLADFGKQKVAASVGGNEGETWEEPDQTDGDMNPKEIVPKSNALADAGTSSGWDWTDPQHGTAPDNAVMSHTP